METGLIEHELLPAARKAAGRNGVGQAGGEQTCQHGPGIGNTRFHQQIEVIHLSERPLAPCRHGAASNHDELGAGVGQAAQQLFAMVAAQDDSQKRVVDERHQDGLSDPNRRSGLVTMINRVRG